MTAPAPPTPPTMLPRLQTIHDSLLSRKLERSRETAGNKDREMLRAYDDVASMRQSGVRR